MATCKDSASEAQIRASLMVWRDNDARLQPLLQQSFLLKELAPLSQDLSALAAASLQALDALDKGEKLPDSWRAEQAARIEQAKKPKAELLLMVAPSLEKLLDATGQSAFQSK